MDIEKQLYNALVAELIKRIEDGTATPADLSVARALLRDCGISIDKQTYKPVKVLENVFPFKAVQDDEL